MNSVITRVGELIEKFADNPAQSKASQQATTVYEILYLLEQENELPEDSLQQIRKQCTQIVGDTKVARALFDTLHLKLAGETYYTKKKPKSPINTIAEKWVRAISGAEERIIEYISNSNSVTQEDRIAMILFSAAAHGGLCHVPGLNALLKTVVEKTVVQPQPIHTQAGPGSDRYIPLRYTGSGHPVNVKTDDERYSKHVFYPPPLTTSTLIGFLRNRHIKNYETDNAIERIRNFLVDLMNDRQLDKITDKRLTEAMSLVFSRRKGARVPAFIQQYAAGRSNGASTFDECLLSLNTRHCGAGRTKPIANKNAGVLDKRNLQTTSDTLIDEIADIFKRYKGDFSERELVLRDLVQLRDENQFSAKAAKPMLSWFIQKFETKIWNCGGSGKRSLSCLGKVWLYMTEDIGAEGLEGLDQTECSSLYTRLRAFESGADSTFPSTLRHFWVFMHNQLGYEIPEQLADFVSGTKFVRCAIPSSHQVRRLLTDLAEAYSRSSKHVIESVTAMTLLMARLGLRPDEAINLEVRDVDLRGDGLVFIRPNEHFNLKSYSAQRTLPLTLFLMADEEAFLRSYCRRRQLETIGRPNALLFTEYEFADTFINYDTLSGNISRLLSGYLNLPTNTYQLRHYALSICSIICCASSERAQRLTDYSASQIEAIKAYFNGANHEDVLSEIAEFAGHINTETLTSTYFHLTDMLRFEAAMSGTVTYPIPFLTKLMSLQGGRLKRLAAKNGGTDTLDSQALMAVLDDIFQTERAHWVETLRPQNVSIKQNIPTFSVKTKRSAEYVGKILHAYDKGVSNKELADVYNLDIHWINEVIHAAHFYRDNPAFQTKKNKPRLYSYETSNNLTIAMPATNIHRLESVDILQSLQQLKGVATNRAAKAAKLILEKTTSNRTFVPLKSKSELRQITKGLRGVVSSERWLLKLHVKRNKDRSYLKELTHWRSALPAEANIKVIERNYAGESSFGYAQLSYLNVALSKRMKVSLNEKDNEYSSSRALASALHKFAIYLCAEDEYLKVLTSS